MDCESTGRNRDFEALFYLLSSHRHYYRAHVYVSINSNLLVTGYFKAARNHFRCTVAIVLNHGSPKYKCVPCAVLSWRANESARQRERGKKSDLSRASFIVFIIIIRIQTRTNTNPQVMCALFSSKMTIWYCCEKKERYDTIRTLARALPTTGKVINACMLQHLRQLYRADGHNGKVPCFGSDSVRHRNYYARAWDKNRPQILSSRCSYRQWAAKQKEFLLRIAFTIRFDTFDAAGHATLSFVFLSFFDDGLHVRWFY